MNHSRDRIKNILKAAGLYVGLRELRRDLWFGKKTARAIRDNERIASLYKAVIRANANCIDIGCHGGEHLEMFCQLAPRGRHLAVEPIPELADLLRHKYPQVTVFAGAASNVCASADLFIPEGKAAWSTLRAPQWFGKGQTRKIEVKTTTIDAIWPGELPVSLIKIDVEGAEHLVLQGLRRLLAADHPFLVFEHELAMSSEFGATSREVFVAMTEFGYRVYSFETEMPLTEEGFCRLAATGEVNNFFAH